MFYKKDALRNFAKFIGKHLCQSVRVSEKLGTGKVVNKVVNKVIKKRLQQRCFHVNIVKFLRTAFFYRTPPVAASVSA